MLLRQSELFIQPNILRGIMGVLDMLEGQSILSDVSCQRLLEIVVKCPWRVYHQIGDVNLKLFNFHQIMSSKD